MMLKFYKAIHFLQRKIFYLLTRLLCLLHVLDLFISDDFFFSLAAIPLTDEQVNRLVAKFCPLCQQKEKYTYRMFFVFNCTFLSYVKGRTFTFFICESIYSNFLFLFLFSFFYLFYSEQLGNHCSHRIFELSQHPVNLIYFSLFSSVQY